jgi:hypothetical protein
MGFHSVRRKFASELKEMPLRDLAHLGGWKNPQTVLAVCQQPSIELQRRGLATSRLVGDGRVIKLPADGAPD